MMSRTKLLGTATAAILAGSLGIAPAATAATTAPAASPASVVAAKPAATTQAVTGTLADGTAFTGAISDLTVRTVDGVLTLTGTITGTNLPAGGTQFTTTITNLAANQAWTFALSADLT